MTRTLLLLACPLFLASCLPNFAAAPVSEEELRLSCDYPNLPGREFVFRETDQALENIAYHPWKRSAEGGERQKPYLAAAGERAKLSPFPLAGRGRDTWFQATSERCQTIFAQRERSESGPPAPDPWRELPDAYFLDTYREAEAKIGRTIYAKATAPGPEQFDTPEPGVNYPKARLEPLTIVGLDTKEYSHTRGSNRPFFLVVRKGSGEEGLLPYDPRYYHESDPADPAWSPELAAKIRAGELMAGMSASQVILAWGKPRKIKPLDSASGGEEQWLFAAGQLLSFRQGVLVQIHSPGKP